MTPFSLQNVTYLFHFHFFSALHPGEQRSYVSCLSLPSAGQPLAAPQQQQSAVHLLSCPARSCAFACDNGQPGRLVQHFRNGLQKQQRKARFRIRIRFVRIRIHTGLRIQDLTKVMNKKSLTKNSYF